MRPPICDLYQMKADFLPDGVRAAWLRTWPDERPSTGGWIFVGRERHPSKWTLADMNKDGFCYRETPSWLGSSSRSSSKQK
jgi:hypothetical protein